MNKLKLNSDAFDDFEDTQTIWEIYGELLDFYSDQFFSSKQISYETGHDKTLINKTLHRLCQLKAVICVGEDMWGKKRYQLNPQFFS